MGIEVGAAPWAAALPLFVPFGLLGIWRWSVWFFIKFLPSLFYRHREPGTEPEHLRQLNEKQESQCLSHSTGTSSTSLVTLSIPTKQSIVTTTSIIAPKTPQQDSTMDTDNEAAEKSSTAKREAGSNGENNTKKRSNASVNEESLLVALEDVSHRDDFGGSVLGGIAAVEAVAVVVAAL